MNIKKHNADVDYFISQLRADLVAIDSIILNSPKEIFNKELIQTKTSIKEAIYYADKHLDKIFILQNEKL